MKVDHAAWGCGSLTGRHSGRRTVSKSSGAGLLLSVLTTCEQKEHPRLHYVVQKVHYVSAPSTRGQAG